MIDTFVYNDLGQINPFLISHVPGTQNTILLGSDFMVKNSDSFYNQVVLNNNEIAIEQNNIFVRAINIKNQVIISIVFTTDCIESDSGRQGLNLTMGAAFNQKIFNSYVPCRAFMEFFISRLENIFSINLSNDGAKRFIDDMNYEENHSSINIKIGALYRDLVSCYFVLRKNVFQFSFRFLTRKRFPSLIFVLANDEKLKYTYTFLDVVDNHLQRTRRIKVSNQKSSVDLYVTIVAILPEIIKKYKSATLSHIKGNSFLTFIK